MIFWYLVVKSKKTALISNVWHAMLSKYAVAKPSTGCCHLVNLMA